MQILNKIKKIHNEIEHTYNRMYGVKIYFIDPAANKNAKKI